VLYISFELNQNKRDGSLGIKVNLGYLEHQEEHLDLLNNKQSRSRTRNVRNK
jgi:hypothetical protein